MKLIRKYFLSFVSLGYDHDIFSWYFSFPTAFSLALGSLYMDHIKMDDTDVVGVLAAASLLEFRELKRT